MMAEPTQELIEETETPAAETPDAQVTEVAEVADTPAVESDDTDAGDADAGDTDAGDADAGDTDVSAAVGDVDSVDVDDEAVAEDLLVFEKLEEEEEVEAAPKPPSPYDRPGKWYVIHTQSGHENKVKQNLEARIASLNMERRIFEVVIPMEDVVEFRQGKKVIVQKKMFPGYVLVRCRIDDSSWSAVRNTPGVTGFVGQGKPVPLRRSEVETFLTVKAEDEAVAGAGPKKTRTRALFEMGETVRVKEGPFADFSGEVIELNEDQLKVKVLVDIFGRETPVELEFSQVAKL